MHLQLGNQGLKRPHKLPIDFRRNKSQSLLEMKAKLGMEMQQDLLGLLFLTCSSDIY
jgi:hypothetical protein